MNERIIPTGKGYLVKPNSRISLPGYYKSYVKAEAALEGYDKKKLASKGKKGAIPKGAK